MIATCVMISKNFHSNQIFSLKSLDLKKKKLQLESVLIIMERDLFIFFETKNGLEICRNIEE